MNKLKAYVGLDNRFVLCERFPDNEEHAGLHDMLQDWVDYDTVFTDNPIEQGFYMLEFEIECKYYTDPTEQDACLVLKSFEKHCDELEIANEKLKQENKRMREGIQIIGKYYNETYPTGFEFTSTDYEYSIYTIINKLLKI